MGFLPFPVSSREAPEECASVRLARITREFLKEKATDSPTVLLMLCRTGFEFRFQSKLTLGFDVGAITRKPGLVVLRELNERSGLTEQLQELFVDQRDARHVEHPALELLRQRVYQIAASYEDANDASFVRHDPTLRAVASRRGEPPASPPTLSRLENDAPWESIHRFQHLGLQWLCQHAELEAKAGTELILDNRLDRCPPRSAAPELLQRLLRQLHLSSTVDLRSQLGNAAGLLPEAVRRERHPSVVATAAPAGDPTALAVAPTPRRAARR
jgi:hypothetical protein